MDHSVLYLKKGGKEPVISEEDLYISEGEGKEIKRKIFKNKRKEKIGGGES